MESNIKFSRPTISSHILTLVKTEINLLCLCMSVRERAALWPSLVGALFV